eukprot:GGOE01000576.1.p1 GENE.GGOE01000576.1~~GGOE01000576.1.p1  ORF type:complete len:300 (-),score=61.85 GGOE01000576.1:188-1036(-)
MNHTHRVAFTDGEFERLKASLAEHLSPELISERTGPSEITQDYCELLPSGRYSAGCSAVVRVTLKDGAFHEDLGYGQSENQKSKGTALEWAKKTAISDGLKRALRYFGQALGLSVYDKPYLKAMKERSPKTTMFRVPSTPKHLSAAHVAHPFRPGCDGVSVNAGKLVSSPNQEMTPHSLRRAASDVSMEVPETKRQCCANAVGSPMSTSSILPGGSAELRNNAECHSALNNGIRSPPLSAPAANGAATSLLGSTSSPKNPKHEQGDVEACAQPNVAPAKSQI